MGVSVSVSVSVSVRVRVRAHPVDPGRCLYELGDIFLSQLPSPGRVVLFKYPRVRGLGVIRV